MVFPGFLIISSIKIIMVTYDSVTEIRALFINIIHFSPNSISLMRSNSAFFKTQKPVAPHPTCINSQFRVEKVRTVPQILQNFE